MAKNSKPILSVLIEEDKRTKFADLARRHSLSMGWLVNQAIDRMLDADSIDIYRDSIERVPAATPIEQLVSASIDNTDIENLISKFIDKYLQNNSVGLTHQEVRDIAAATIKDSISFERLCNEGAVIGVAEKIVNSAFNPLSQAIVKLEADTRSQFAAVRDEIERAISNRSVTAEAVANVPTSPRKEKPNADGDTRTWCGFFEMVGMTAMTATEAQKKENTDIRTQQIERGLRAATDKGLGEWAVKRAGRDFVRVDTNPESTLPLFNK